MNYQEKGQFVGPIPTGPQQTFTNQQQFATFSPNANQVIASPQRSQILSPIKPQYSPGYGQINNIQYSLLPATIQQHHLLPETITQIQQLSQQQVTQQQQYVPQYQQQVPQQKINYSTYYQQQPNLQQIYVQPQLQYSRQIIEQQPIKHIIETQPQQQVVQEVHHVERPIEVITIEEIESPWRLKCATLERQILELQIQLRKGGMVSLETVEVIDDTKVNELENKKKRLLEMMDQRDREIEEMRQKIEQLQEEIQTITTEKISYVTNNIEVWKKKYDGILKETDEAERELAQVSKDLDKLKREQANQQQQQTSSTQVRTETKRQSRIY